MWFLLCFFSWLGFDSAFSLSRESKCARGIEVSSCLLCWHCFANLPQCPEPRWPLAAGQHRGSQHQCWRWKGELPVSFSWLSGHLKVDLDFFAYLSLDEGSLSPPCTWHRRVGRCLYLGCFVVVLLVKVKPEFVSDITRCSCLYINHDTSLSLVYKIM